MLLQKIIGKDRIIAVQVAVFSLLIIFIIAIGFYAVKVQDQIVVEDENLKLLSIADLKINQINSWRKERLIDAKAMLYSEAFAMDVERWFNNNADREAEKRIDRYLKQFLESNYYKIQVIDKNMNVKKCLYGPYAPISPSEKELVSEAFENRRITFSDFQTDDINNIIHLDLIIPLLVRNSVIGAVIMKINPSFFLFPYIQTWPVPSRTSETLIVERRGDSVLFLNELRQRKNTAMKFKISLEKKQVLAVKGVLGEEGNLSGIDYRDKPVMGAVRRVPGTKWIVVAKTDTDEIYAGEREKAFLIYALLVIFSSFSGVALFLYIKTQNKTQYAKLLELELEKQKTANKLVALETKFQSLFGSMNEGAALYKIILNEKGEPVDYVVIDVNPAFCRLAGLDIEKSRGNTASSLFNMNPPPFLDIYYDVAITGRPYEFETYFSKLSKHFRISVSCPGHMTFAAIFLDITESKEYEQKLKTSVMSLEQSNKELEQFAYVASHDLQEPLRMVSSFTQLLAKKYKGLLSEEADSYINYAVDGASRMQVLINDLLDYSRVTRKGQPFSMIDSSSVLGHAVANLRKKIQENHAMITNGELPVVKADEGQLIRLFQNLIDNAIKYRSADVPIIHITAYDNSGEWVFSVKDNGIGIEPEYYERIFEIFERLHSASKYPGTGIGLAICKKIVERHGGRMWVEANDDQGVTFNFTINKRDV